MRSVKVELTRQQAQLLVSMLTEATTNGGEVTPVRPADRMALAEINTEVLSALTDNNPPIRWRHFTDRHGEGWQLTMANQIVAVARHSVLGTGLQASSYRVILMTQPPRRLSVEYATLKEARAGAVSEYLAAVQADSHAFASA